MQENQTVTYFTKTTQKEGFSKLCVKIKKRCYTDLLHFSTSKHNLVSFSADRILTVEQHVKFIILVSNLKEISPIVFS
jgi:hypothetical protein